VAGTEGAVHYSVIPLLCILPVNIVFRILLFGRLRVSANAIPLEQSWPKSAEGLKVSVIVPAYNEDGCIERTCRAALSSTTAGPDRFELVVVDDQSSDRTWEIISNDSPTGLAADPRMVAVKGGTRDGADWKGKNWAVWQGFLKATGDILIFMDGDVVLQSGALESLLHRFFARDSVWLTVCCFSDFQSTAEYVFGLPITIGVMQALAVPRVDLGHQVYAYGQLNVFRRQIYEQLGGHRAVGHVVAESHELAKLAVAANLKIDAAFAFAQTRLEWYTDFHDCWQGQLKSICARLKPKPKCVRFAVLLFAVIYVIFVWLPWVILPWQIVLLADDNLDDGTVWCSAALAGTQIFLVFVQRVLARIKCGYKLRMWYMEPLTGVLVAAMLIRAAVHPQAKWKSRSNHGTNKKLPRMLTTDGLKSVLPWGNAQVVPV